ncbi:MAG TPA: DUF1289 domain-containing protein [Xanthobacteraceae bacterium]|nr:DUF1289 domain-containing protein [Xanthobacteraceae bacterium]
MLPIDSPCTKVCTLHPGTGLCMGCGRTLGEIERWPALSPPARRDLMVVVAERLARMRACNWLPSPTSDGIG